MDKQKSVDDFIRNAKQWQGELKRLRGILSACELKEEIKWGAPCYTFNGKNVVGIGAFKSYFGLWFHQGALLKDTNAVLMNAQEGKTKALRQWRMTSSGDIKPTVIKRYVGEAVQLVRDNREIKPTRSKSMVVARELQAALAKHKTTLAAFEGLTPGRQREYSEYILDAKRDATKSRRIEKIIPIIVAGGGLNDRYR